MLRVETQPVTRQFLESFALIQERLSRLTAARYAPGNKMFLGGNDGRSP
jgi:hypothetical protein